MRTFFLILFSAMLAPCQAQRVENVILITTDGLRWQEVFGGMDTAIANNPRFNEDDSLLIYQKYWSPDSDERRKKLLPFTWSTLAAGGRLYGNRTVGNKVDNSNRYWFSYPGYNELLTGFPDTAINSNSYPPNPHVTVLEFINRLPSYKGKVAAFGAWEAFNRIINEGRSGIPVTAAYDSCGGHKPTANEKLLNAMLKDVYRPWGNDECLDVFTHYAAMETLKQRRPKVLYIAYGETDEWAHAGKYRSYLDAAHQVDAWLKEIWTWVQKDPQYRNKTAIFITTDHGRGDLVKTEWTDHGASIQGASQIWFAVMSPDITAGDESKSPMQLYQKQIPQTLARLLGLKYTAAHPIAGEVHQLWDK